MASQSSSSGCVGRAPWVPKSSVVRDQAPAEVRLPELVHRPRGRPAGCPSSTSQRASVRRFARRARRERVEDRGHARLDRLARLEELAALVDVRRPRVLGRALLHHHRGREPGQRPPQLGDRLAAPWPARGRPTGSSSSSRPRLVRRSGSPRGRAGSSSTSAGRPEALTGRRVGRGREAEPADGHLVDELLVHRDVQRRRPAGRRRDSSLQLEDGGVRLADRAR